MTREEVINSAAAEYAEKNQTVIRNMLPSVIAMTSFVNAIRWLDEHPELNRVNIKIVEKERGCLIRDVCDWLRRSTILSETTIERLKKEIEEPE